MQLQTGYLFDFIKKKLLESHDNSEVTALVFILFWNWPDKKTIDNSKPELAVLSNLLSKRTTYQTKYFSWTVFIERFQNRWNETDEWETWNNSKQFIWIVFQNFFSNHFTQLTQNKKPEKIKLKLEPVLSLIKSAANMKKIFVQTHSPIHRWRMVSAFLESQREFTSIVILIQLYETADRFMSTQQQFPLQDFHYKHSGIVIEVDGPHHWENQKPKWFWRTEITQRQTQVG